MLVVKELRDCLFFLIETLVMIIEILTEDTSFLETDGRNNYDQPINDLIKPTGQVDDYITGCLLDFAYFKKITN